MTPDPHSDTTNLLHDVMPNGEVREEFERIGQPNVLAPPVERVTESDRLLLVSMLEKAGQLRMRANEMQELVMNHFSAVYGLQLGDHVEASDGRIVRKSSG